MKFRALPRKNGNCLEKQSQKEIVSVIELKHLSKTFHTGEGELHALEDISLTIRTGDIFGIVGMSGAGKSTLVRCINLLEKPTSGQVLVDGLVDGGGTGPLDMCQMTPTQLRQARRSISMIFQQFNLLMQRTCLKNICFPMEIAGVPAAQARKRALELLDIVGLPDKADAYPVRRGHLRPGPHHHPGHPPAHPGHQPAPGHHRHRHHP